MKEKAIAEFLGTTPDDGVALALLSGAVAHGDSSLVKATLRALRDRGTSPQEMHEVILQSHLFCGFPRMLDALFDLAEIVPPAEYLSGVSGIARGNLAYSPAEVASHESDGRALIRRVYAERYERLEEAIWGMSPAVFRLMVIDGYGKTLSRPGLEVKKRELCVVAALVVERRVRQLRAHLRGALNVGATPDQIRNLIDALDMVADKEKCDTARELLEDILGSQNS